MHLINRLEDIPGGSGAEPGVVRVDGQAQALRQVANAGRAAGRDVQVSIEIPYI